MRSSRSSRSWNRFADIDFEAAARRIDGAVHRTPLEAIPCEDPRIELRAKLENRQVTGSFKARGAWNSVARLSESERANGVVACSSGNHGKALAWAAARAGVPATIVMPADAYANKVEACRDAGAEVVLAPSRRAAEDIADARVAEGWTLIHPYDRAETVEGAGTVGLEIAADWPEVEVVVVPVGGGGLLAGASLALRRRLGDALVIVAVEPEGAPTMKLGLDAGHPVTVDVITTEVQGLCPLDAGAINVEICRETVDDVVLLDDGAILRAQRRLVAGGEIVEPAGAAACALVFERRLPESLVAGRSAEDPLRVCAVVSGGNPDPVQLAAIRGET